MTKCEWNWIEFVYRTENIDGHQNMDDRKCICLNEFQNQNYTTKSLQLLVTLDKYPMNTVVESALTHGMYN